MNKMYVIHWKSTVNGRAGTGSKLFDREAAESLVDELNREYPQIEHEMWEAPPGLAEETTGKPSNASARRIEPRELMRAS
jgi:hypothetical protein